MIIGDPFEFFALHGLTDENGLMARRHASINDVRIDESERKYHWDLDGPRPADHPGLSDLDL